MTRSPPVFDDLFVSDALPTLLVGDAIEGCNAAAGMLLGADEPLLRSLPLERLLPSMQPDGSDSLPAWRERMRAARSGLGQWFLWQFVRADGMLVDALVHLEADDEPGGSGKGRLREPAGPAPVRARLRDLTRFRGVEWSHMQQALAGTDAIVFAKDVEGRYLFANRQFARITGVRLDALIGRRDADVLPPAMAEECRRNDALVLAERRPLDFEEHGELDGEPRTYLALKFPLLRADGSACGVWGIATDISARKRAEQAQLHAALAVSQADGEGLVQGLTRYLATILKADLALIGVIEGDDEARTVRTIGCYSYDGGDGIYLDNFSYSLDSTPCRTALDGFRLYPHRVYEAFPRSRWLAESRIESYAGYPLRGSDGRLLGVIAVLSRSPMENETLIESVLRIFAGRAADEIERRRAEDALRMSEEQYRSIFNASVDGLLLWNSAGQVVDVNEAFQRMHGFGPDETIGRGCAPFVPVDRQAECRRKVNAALAGNELSCETVACRKDGSLFDVELHLVPMQYRNEPHVLAIVRDLTERRREETRRAQLEAQLRQAQKMEAIGHLTGGIAHDFNNLLASILGYVVLAAERQAERGDAKTAHYLEQARLSCERARDLIRQMLTFSRGRRGESRPLLLGAAVRDAVRLLRASFPSTLEMQVDLDADLPAVLIDPVQLEQVLLNLCINARDAMCANGAVRVATGWRHGYHGVCASCRQSVEGDFVELAVADTGPGIAAPVLDRMFEPFFSTKEVGKGSGMGLATVHGIVHDHRGHVIVESAAGAGATFRVLLPALDPAVEVGRPGAQEPVAAPGARGASLGGRVLLVDDEAAVLGFMRELLENWGLQVSAITDPEEARRLVAAGELDFDLLLVDQTMPHLTGTGLARAIATLRPDVPVLLYTGYRDGVSPADLGAGGIRAVLDKPVDPALLHAQLERYLPHVTA
ncbi:MAG: PAS domain S-box protein [Burkholderiaceae bacterium]|nr:PAS domain S-box protein [Burkholderiaceae bacterium]